MSNLSSIKRSLEYIESHIKDKIELKEIAGYVNFSEYHLHRMFRGITGYTLKDYVRKRRLYLAALDIMNHRDTLVNIAHDYQFSSQASFSVAFKQMHGLTPSEVRQSKRIQPFGEVALNRIELKRPDGLMKEPILVHLDGFSVTGLDCQTNYNQLVKEDNPINRLWMSIQQQLNMDEEMSLYAVYQYNPAEIHLDNISFTYLLGFKNDEDKSCHIGSTVNHIPESPYLLFQVDTSKTDLFDVYDYIDENWLPHSDYILSEVADFEVHKINNSTHKNANIVDIYISVKE